MTTLTNGTTPRLSRLVAWVTPAIGIALFAACSLDQLSHSSIEQSWPSLVAYGLFFLVGMPVFAASLSMIWKHRG